MDAKDIMSEVQNLEAQLRGDEVEVSVTQGIKDSVYTGGYAEQFAKNKK